MDGPGGQGLPVRLTHARHEDKSEHRTWDFLQGEGPSSVQMYYAEEKKAFKPGWKSLRPQQVIRQQEQRLQQEEVKVCSDPLSGVYNNFNPITGMACKQDGTWAPASDPWQHQTLGLKPAQPSPQAAEAKANKAQRAAGIVAMRQERIATDGLCYCKRVGVASITMISVRNPLQDYFTASVWGAQ
ncbi:MAG: hypothetical protein WDW38_007771 [Sanguina aurantia]